MKKVIAFCGMLACMPAAFADGIGAHGGNVVVCPGKPAVTLDYYHATLQTLAGPVGTVDVSRMSEKEVVDLFRGLLNGMPALRNFDAALAKNGPMASWIATSLATVNDSDEPYVLPAECKRVTGAIRQGDTMYVDPEVYVELSPAQRGMLLVHEALYRASGQDSSRSVREFVRQALRKTKVQADLSKSVWSMGLSVYWYELLSGDYYAPDEHGKTHVCELSFRSERDVGPTPVRIEMLLQERSDPHCSNVMDLPENYLECKTGDQGCVARNGCRIDVISEHKIMMKCLNEERAQAYTGGYSR